MFTNFEIVYENFLKKNEGLDEPMSTYIYGKIASLTPDYIDKSEPISENELMFLISEVSKNTTSLGLEGCGDILKELYITKDMYNDPEILNELTFNDMRLPFFKKKSVDPRIGKLFYKIKTKFDAMSTEYDRKALLYEITKIDKYLRIDLSTTGFSIENILKATGVSVVTGAFASIMGNTYDSDDVKKFGALARVLGISVGFVGIIFAILKSNNKPVIKQSISFIQDAKNIVTHVNLKLKRPFETYFLNENRTNIRSL